MTELEKHIALLNEHCEIMSAQIGALHDGESRIALRAMLSDIESQIQTINQRDRNGSYVPDTGRQWAAHIVDSDPRAP